jgi:hypothetical protein
VKKKQTSEIYTKTVEEYGPTLPIGLVDSSGTVLHKDIEIRPWRMKEERELSELRDKNKNSSMTSYISMVLATMCTKLGIYDFSNMSFDKKRSIISQMYMADVFYTYVWLRINSLGEKFPVTFHPVWSNKPINMVADLNSIETKCVNELKAINWEYKLKNPIKIRGTEVSTFNMTQQRWNTIELLEESGPVSSLTAKQSLILASISGCKEIDKQIVLTLKELDELVKLDIERLAFLIDEKSLGPKMILEGEHKGREFTTPIDWGYDNFFAVSSV